MLACGVSMCKTEVSFLAASELHRQGKETSQEMARKLGAQSCKPVLSGLLNTPQTTYTGQHFGTAGAPSLAQPTLAQPSSMNCMRHGALLQPGSVELCSNLHLAHVVWLC